MAGSACMLSSPPRASVEEVGRWCEMFRRRSSIQDVAGCRASGTHQRLQGPYSCRVNEAKTETRIPVCLWKNLWAEAFELAGVILKAERKVFSSSSTHVVSLDAGTTSRETEVSLRATTDSRASPLSVGHTYQSRARGRDCPSARGPTGSGSHGANDGRIKTSVHFVDTYVLDDGTGVIMCKQRGTTAAPSNALSGLLTRTASSSCCSHARYRVGDFVKLTGTLVLLNGATDRHDGVRVSPASPKVCFIIESSSIKEDPNAETVWFMQVALQRCLFDVWLNRPASAPEPTPLGGHRRRKRDLPHCGRISS